MVRVLPERGGLLRLSRDSPSHTSVPLPLEPGYRCSNVVSIGTVTNFAVCPGSTEPHAEMPDLSEVECRLLPIAQPFRARKALFQDLDAKELRHGWNRSVRSE
jgi:hypothetical protein